MVLAQGTLLFVHHSNSPILTFWSLEFFIEKRNAETTDLQQLDVELLPIPVDGPCRSRHLHRI